jgi:hypothetical protein
MLLINLNVGACSVIDIFDINDLPTEIKKEPGLFFFFDGKYNLVKFGCSYDDVVSHAKANCHEENIYSYYIFSAPDFTEDYVDKVYDNVEGSRLHMNPIMKGINMDIELILN